MKQKGGGIIRRSWIHALLIVFILLTAMSAVIYSQSMMMKGVNDESEKAVISLLSDNANQVSGVLDNQIRSIWAHMGIIDNSLEVMEEMTAEGAEKFLSGIFPLALHARLATEDGEYIDENGNRGYIESDSDMLRLFADKERICTLQQSGITDSILFGMPVKPFKIEGREYCFVLVYFALDSFMDVISIDSFAGEGQIRILNDKGFVIMSTDNIESDKRSYYFFKVYENSTFRFNDEYDDFEGFRQSVMSGDNYAVHVISEDNEDNVISYAKTEEMDWYVTIVVGYREVLGGLEESVKTIGGTSILFTLGVVLIALPLVAFIANDAYRVRQEKLNLEELNNSLAHSKMIAEQALYEAEEANRAKSVFLSSMSHDIRTPMNAIMGFLTLLDRDAQNPEKVREYAKKMKLSSSYLLSLINDVLDMAKIESGKVSLKLSEANLSDLLEDINTIIRPQMKEKNHNFEIRTHQVSHEVVCMDKLRIRQILLNLLSNAVKYTPDGGHIVLELTELAGSRRQYARYRFSVADNGYGIDPEFRDSIFDVFSREQNSMVNKIHGTGLGLAITKNLVDMMEGSISVESRKDEGSVFTVELELMPVINADGASHEDLVGKHGTENMLSEDEENELQNDSQGSLKGMHILVAEDNELNAEILTDLLDIEGADCDIFENGQLVCEAFENSNEDKYRLILMDVQMPVMNGYEATERIRSCSHPRAKTIPIIAMTANAFEEDIQNALDSGMNAHMAKPINMKKLVKIIDDLI